MNTPSQDPIQQALDQKRADADMRKRIKMLFNSDPEVRLDAQEALKEAWGYDEPSFKFEELASFPAENCTTVAARRDGVKELIAWLCKL